MLLLGVGGGRRLVAFANAFRPRPPSRGLRIKSESDWPILVMHILFRLQFTESTHTQWTRADNGAGAHTHTCDIYLKQKGRRLSSYLCAACSDVTLSNVCMRLSIYARPDMIWRTGETERERRATLKPPISQQPNYTRCAITLSEPKIIFAQLSAPGPWQKYTAAACVSKDESISSAAWDKNRQQSNKMYTADV